MHLNELKPLIRDALEDLKAIDLTMIDVSEKSSFTDLMVVATGNTSRQVKALADNLIERAKKSGHPPLGVEGERDAEWILVDLGDAVVHLMVPKVREFYSLEKLWSVNRKEPVDEPNLAATHAAVTDTDTDTDTDVASG